MSEQRKLVNVKSPGDRQPSGLRAALRTLVLSGTLLSLPACYDQIVDPEVESNGRVSIINDEDELEGRVHYLEENVPIDAPASPVGPAAVGPFRAPSSVSLTLVAELDPPQVESQTVQATSISARSEYSVLISYNVQGASQLGAVDRVANLFGRYPVVTSSVSFNDSDVNAVALDGNYLYAAQATDNMDLGTPAVLERLRVTLLGIRLENNARVPLSSFAGTSALATDDAIYATSGDGGGVYAFDPDDLNTLLGEYALDDARWVARDSDNNRIVVLQGTPGRIAVFEEGAFPGGSMNLLGTYSFPGADVAESKSTVEIVGGKAFIAAGPEGVQVMCLDDGQIVGSVPRPDPASLGLDPSVVVTNAVTVQGDLMFISNGEAGVYVAAGAQDFAATACSTPQSIAVMGRLRFDDLQSVNHVDYTDDKLLVAAGLGGLKIVEVDITP